MYTISNMRRALAPFVIAVAVPLAAHAQQDNELFTWSGRVDREVRLTVRGNQVLNSTEQNMQTRPRSSMRMALPARDGTLRVVTEAGRGTVYVDQQPSAQNGYTAIIRLDDNDGGADNYRIRAYFDPNGGYRRGGVSNGDVYDRGRDDGRGSGRWGRNEPTLHWSGDVRGSVDLYVRNGSVTPRVVNGVAPMNVQTSVTGNMANDVSSSLQLNLREGRGRVEVLQQPSARNRYTGIIRITDGSRGFGHYSFDALMR